MRSTNRPIDQSVAEWSRTCINSFAFFLVVIVEKKKKKKKKKGPKKTPYPSHATTTLTHTRLFSCFVSCDSLVGGPRWRQCDAAALGFSSCALFVHEQKPICASIHPSIQQEPELFPSLCFRLKWTTLVAYKCAGLGGGGRRVLPVGSSIVLLFVFFFFPACIVTPDAPSCLLSEMRVSRRTNNNNKTSNKKRSTLQW